MYEATVPRQYTKNQKDPTTDRWNAEDLLIVLKFNFHRG